MKLVLQAVTAIGITLVAQGGGQFREWKDAALADNPRLAPNKACAWMAPQTPYDLPIVSTAVVRAAGETPEYCRLVGLIQPEIRFEVNLPAVWNGRLYMFGNGGYAGEAIDNPA